MTGPPVLAGVTLRDKRSGMQSFARIPGGGWLFTQVTQGRPGTARWHSRRGDLTLSCVADDGSRVLSWMHLKGFGHGQSVSVQPATDGLRIWVEAVSVQGPDTNPNGYGTQIARFTWAPRRTITPWSPGVELYDPVPRCFRVSPSLSAADHLIGARYMTDDSKHHVAVYPLDRFLARDYTPVRVIAEPPPPPPRPTPQGWALLPGGTRVVLLTGDHYPAAGPPPGNTKLKVYGAGGITQQAVTDAPGLRFREPEGVQPGPAGQVCYGFASRPRRRRLSMRANIYCRDVAPVTAPPPPAGG